MGIWEAANEIYGSVLCLGAGCVCGGGASVLLTHFQVFLKEAFILDQLVVFLPAFGLADLRATHAGQLSLLAPGL